MGGLDEAVVDGQLLAGGDVAGGDVDPVGIGGKVDVQVGRVAVVDEPRVVTAEDEPVQPSIDVAVVLEDAAEMVGLAVEDRRIEIEIESRRETPDRRSAGDGGDGEDAQPVDRALRETDGNEQHGDEVLWGALDRTGERPKALRGNRLTARSDNNAPVRPDPDRDVCPRGDRRNYLPL